MAGVIDEGHFNDTRLDGLRWALLLQWPGEIAEGNGRWQAIIDERGSAAQREALRKILHGESTAPGATHFYVFRSTMSEVLDPIYAPIELSIDVPARRARLRVPGRDRFGRLADHRPAQRARAPRPDPPAERLRVHRGRGGNAGARARAAASSSTLEGSHGHFNELHMNQDGVIR